MSGDSETEAPRVHYAGAVALLARHGWRPFGYHADSGSTPELEFSPQLDVDGDPLFERPKLSAGRSRITIRVVWRDQNWQDYPVPSGQGWTVRDTNGVDALVIGHGVPRVHVPLVGVESFQVLDTP